MPKDKIAISVDHQLLKTLDQKVDGSMIRSRSQAIEYFLRKGIVDDGVRDAVILVKEEHQRISMQPYKGKRLLNHQLSFLSSHGIEKVYYVTQRPARNLREHLMDSSVEIVEHNGRGNAQALLAFKTKVRQSFVVMSGDTLHHFDLNGMINKHTSLKTLATMGLMTRERSSGYGTAILNGDYIVDFREKKKSSSHIVNAGIYVFTPSIFELLKGNSLERDVFPTLAKINSLAGYFTYGEYEHFG